MIRSYRSLMPLIAPWLARVLSAKQTPELTLEAGLQRGSALAARSSRLVEPPDGYGETVTRSSRACRAPLRCGAGAARNDAPRLLTRPAARRRRRGAAAVGMARSRRALRALRRDHRRCAPRPRRDAPRSNPLAAPSRGAPPAARRAPLGSRAHIAALTRFSRDDRDATRPRSASTAPCTTAPCAPRASRVPSAARARLSPAGTRRRRSRAAAARGWSGRGRCSTSGDRRRARAPPSAARRCGAPCRRPAP